MSEREHYQQSLIIIRQHTTYCHIGLLQRDEELSVKGKPLVM